MNIEKKIDAFFDAYAKRFNDALGGKEPNITETVNAFAEHFIEASPLGVICGENDKTFREAIPKGNEFYKSIGTESMNIESKEITTLDDFHFMVKVRWNSIYNKKDGARITIDFDVFYFLQHRDDQLKVFAYITGDEQKLLKERGLIPANEAMTQ